MELPNLKLFTFVFFYVFIQVRALNAYYLRVGKSVKHEGHSSEYKSQLEPIAQSSAQLPL